jgi:hypothetical protein
MEQFKNIYFYLYFGNGDIFISKEFVKDILSQVKYDTAYYSHGKNKRILADIPELNFAPITNEHIPNIRCRLVNNDLFVNCWLGVDSTYVTPANSCSVTNSKRMYNDIFSKTHLDIHLNKSLGEYIPQIDYKYFELEGVNNFISSNNKKFFLWDNGLVQSNQANNFDFTPAIDTISRLYPHINIVTTSRTPLLASNIFFTGDITKPSDGFDLNEISYLSTFTNLIVGRSSGPEVFCTTRENVYNPNKRFISFTYRIESSSIVWGNPEIPSKIYWSSSVDTGSIVEQIRRVIEEGI